MKELALKILNEEGMHARPAGIFVKEASQFKSKIEIISAFILTFSFLFNFLISTCWYFVCNFSNNASSSSSSFVNSFLIGFRLKINS